MDIERSFVYIMQASNGLVKIGKSNNVDARRWQLEQGANMFNDAEKLSVKIIKSYPCISEIYAFALEAHLHEYFSECQAGTSSREVFRVDAQEVVKVADIWHRAFTVAQSIQYHELMFRKTDKD